MTNNHNQTEALKLPAFIVRAVERAVHEATHPTGMTTNGPAYARIEASQLALLLRIALSTTAAPVQPQEVAPVAWVITVGPDFKNEVGTYFNKEEADAEYAECTENGVYESVYQMHPLYTAPSAQAAPQQEVSDEQIARAVDAGPDAVRALLGTQAPRQESEREALNAFTEMYGREPDKRGSDWDWRGFRRGWQARAALGQPSAPAEPTTCKLAEESPQPDPVEELARSLGIEYDDSIPYNTGWFPTGATQAHSAGDAIKALFSAKSQPIGSRLPGFAYAQRFQWLCEDHGDEHTRRVRDNILNRMPVMSLSAACQAIDYAMIGEYHLPDTAAPVAAPVVPDTDRKDAEQYDKLLKLARRTMWLAYVWNDHNFDAAHKCARETCEAIGIKSFDEANAFLDAAAPNPDDKRGSEG